MSKQVDVLGLLDAAIVGVVNDPIRERRGHRENLIEARAAVAELMDKADNAATALSNLIAARQVDCGYSGVVTDLTAAIARCEGGAA